MSVSASELADIQADCASWLDLPCTIQRSSRTQDGTGQYSENYATISQPGLLCGLAQPTAGQLANYSYEIGDLAAWQVHFPVGTDVIVRDHLIISGQTLNVHIDLTPRSLPGLLTVIAAEIK